MSKAKKYLAALTVSLTLLIGFGLFTSPLFANNTNAGESTLTWNVSGKAESTYTGATKALVYDFQELNGKMYVGGKFLNIVDPDGNELTSANGDAPAFLAAFDIQTGAWDKTFFPTLDGPVYALNVRADGTLLAGGEFDGGVVALDPATGDEIANFNPMIRRAQTRPPAVMDMAVVGDRIYVGGSFTKSANLNLQGLARLDSTTGAVDPTWIPSADKLVYGIDVDETRSRLYVVGAFEAINGNTDAAFFATLSTGTGQLDIGVDQGLPGNIVNHRTIRPMTQFDVQSSGDAVYVGGEGHQTMILNAADLKPNAVYVTNRSLGDGENNRGGDTQAIFVDDSVIASACHCWGGVDEYVLGSYNNEDGTQSEAQYYKHVNDFATISHQNVQGIYLVDKNTNQLLPNQFEISGAAGGWAITIDSSGSLWSGGQFNNRRKGPSDIGLVRFGSQPANAPEAPLPTTPETTVTEIVEITAPPLGGDAPALAPINDTPPVTTTPPEVSEQTSTTGETEKNTPQKTVQATTTVAPRSPSSAPVTETTAPPAQTPTHFCAAPVPQQFSVEADSAGQIYRLYCAYFGRYPDDQGFADWQERHKNGYSMKQISAHFEASNENKPNRLNLDNADFVASLYERVLMREDTTSDGYKKWVTALDNGMPRSELMLNFSNSKEFRVLTGAS